MTLPTMTCAGIAVVLGFALLGTRRTRAMAALCAAQALVVAVGALVQGKLGVAAVEIAEAAAIAWLSGWLHDAAPATRGPAPTIAPLVAAGTVLAVLATAIPGAGLPLAMGLPTGPGLAIPATGLPLAIVLLGLLLVGGRQPVRQALGLVAVQNGLVLAGVATGSSGALLVLVVVPVLPALALGALWLGQDRARTALLRAPDIVGRIEWHHPPNPAGWIDAALCGLALLLAATLPWLLGAEGNFWRLDALAVLVILLLAALAAAGSWTDRNATRVGGSHFVVLAGAVFAVAATAPLLQWLGMTLATVGAAAAALPIRAEAWRRLRLGCAGLSLALFGTIALQAVPLGTLALHAVPLVPAATLDAGAPVLSTIGPALSAIGPAVSAIAPALSAIACVMLGYGTLAVLAPELAIAAATLILRWRGAATDDLLLALGLAALVVAAIGLGAQASRRRLPALAGLAHGGVAIFAIGLGTESGALAGLLQLGFLALTQCALLLAREHGLDRLAALAGLAGVPPCGVFPSLALVIAATAGADPWLLLPLGAGLAAVAWVLLLRLPPERRPLPSPAWVPLALLLACGFAMPDPLLAWFRLAVQ